MNVGAGYPSKHEPWLAATHHLRSDRRLLNLCDHNILQPPTCLIYTHHHYYYTIMQKSKWAPKAEDKEVTMVASAKEATAPETQPAPTYSAPVRAM